MDSKYTKEYLEPIVKDSYSLREVARRLSLGENNATNNLRPHILRLGIDTSHFSKVGRKRKYRFTNEEVFQERSLLRPNNAGKNGGGSLRKRLKNYKEYKCEICNNLGLWNNKELVLDVDHINGINTDNRLENLRFLCPNCHTQQPTSNGKNKKNKESQSIDDNNR